MYGQHRANGPPRLSLAVKAIIADRLRNEELAHRGRVHWPAIGIQVDGLHARRQQGDVQRRRAVARGDGVRNAEIIRDAALEPADPRPGRRHPAAFDAPAHGLRFVLAYQRHGQRNLAIDPGHHAVQPPSTIRLWPVTYADASDARYSTAGAISSERAMRPMGVRALYCWTNRSGCPAKTPPGV